MKAVMFYYLLARLLVKMGTTAYVYFFGQTELPAVVLIILTAVIAIGIAVIVRYFMGKSSKKEMAVFFTVDTAAILFNMLFIRMSAPVEIGQADTMAIGTILDVIINVALVVYAFRKRPYINMGNTVVKTAQAGTVTE